MDKHFLASIVWSYEAPAFGHIEPLAFSETKIWIQESICIRNTQSIQYIKIIYKNLKGFFCLIKRLLWNNIFNDIFSWKT